MPPHIHYLSHNLTFPVHLHHRKNHHRRREPPQQPPAHPSSLTLVCNGYHLLRCRATQWDDSNAEYFTTVNFDDESLGEEDYTLKWDLDVFEEYIESIWILKVFRGYGVAMPFVLAPLVLVNGLESLLLAVFASIWAYTFSFAVQKMLDSQKNMKRNTKKEKRARNKFGNSKKAEKGYKTWVESDDESSFGGWDEIDHGNGYTERKKRRRRRRREDTTSSPLLLRLLITIFPFLF